MNDVNPRKYSWNEEKNKYLQTARNRSFEEVVSGIAGGHVLDLVEYPIQEKYKGQRLFVVEIHGYAWLVPLVETAEEVFLKTVIPNRKATRKYPGERHEIPSS
ncbi:toxin [bacterium]|nr:toxin [bacterium]